MKRCYKLIFIFFEINLICNNKFLHGNTMKNVCSLGRIAINVLITAVSILANISMLLAVDQMYSYNYICFMIGNFSYIIFRVILSWTYHKLVIAANQVSKFKGPDSRLLQKMAIFWELQSIMFHIAIAVLFILPTALAVDILDFYFTRNILLGYTTGSQYVDDRICDAYICVFVFLCMMPLTTFLLFYAMICYHLRFVLKTFRKSMLPCAGPPHYRHLLRSYLWAKRLVLDSDGCLTWLITICAIHVGIYMHFSYCSFRSGMIKAFKDLTTLSVIASYSAICLLIAFSSAAALQGESEAIAEVARSLPENPHESDFSHVQFLTNVDKGMNMTFAGILDITQNFILVFFGTVITYSVVLESALFGNMELLLHMA